MKLAYLLAQYLYAHQQLDLPGIGSFRMEGPVYAEQETTRGVKAPIPPGISFENKTIREAPELIAYISAQTGKIRALAAADLDSHLELALQFLNIGKPFLLEGIGNLVKIGSREFAFTSGQVLPESMKDYSAREISSTSTSEESFTDYRNILSGKKAKVEWKRPAVFLLIIFGIALAIWGGYTVYKRTTAHNKEKQEVELQPVNEVKKDEPVAVTQPDTTVHYQKDSVITITPPVPPVRADVPLVAGNQYKFIIETAAKERGLKRYNTLKGFGLNIQMETTDSVNFRLYFVLNAVAADTTRMIDSLRGIYTPSWSRAFVEK